MLRDLIFFLGQNVQSETKLHTNFRCFVPFLNDLLFFLMQDRPSYWIKKFFFYSIVVISLFAWNPLLLVWIVHFWYVHWKRKWSQMKSIKRTSIPHMEVFCPYFKYHCSSIWLGRALPFVALLHWSCPYLVLMFEVLFEVLFVRYIFHQSLDSA